MRESSRAPSATAGRLSFAQYKRLGAISITLLMLASSGAFIAAGALAAPAHSVATPLASSSVLSGVLPGAQIAKEPFTTQPGTGLSSTPNATVVSPTNPNAPMMFTIGFQMRNSEQLAELLQAQSSPGSPMFHQWLTLDQERTMFGADPVAYQNTINYFTSLGFKVQTEGLLSVSFSGTSAQVGQAFHTQISNVAYGTGQVAPMNSKPLSLPAGISTQVASVNGLNGAIIAQPTSYLNPVVLQDMQGSTPTVVPAGQPLPAAVAASSGNPVGNLSTIFNVSNQGYFWVYYYSHSHHAYRTFQVITPGALNALYNGSELINQGINGDSTGTPITIAIIMAGGINPTDMQGWGNIAWNNPNQVLSRLSPTPVDGAFTDNGTVTWTDGASSEMALDIEFSSTMAPAAHIMPVYGPCLCTNVLDDDYALLSTMTKVPNIISNSWGGDEDRWPNLYGPNWANALTMHDYFMLLTGRGATVLASSGDGGGFDTGSGLLSGSFPATDPYVLSVNGLRTSATDSSGLTFPTQTTYGVVNISIGSEPQTPFFYNYPVHASQATHILSQTYWYEPWSNYTLYKAPPQGSGGFDTSYWYNQSWIQHGYGIPDLGRSLGSGVAAEADYNQSIYFDGDMQFFWGGTSFACPTTAGMFALVEDYLAHNGHSPYLGNGNGVVWDVWNAWSNGNLSLKPFYDVASPNGGNANGTSFWGNYGVAQGYEFPPGQKFPYLHGSTTYGNTTAGWDFPTGFGSLIVDNFAMDANQLESMPGTFMTTNAAGTAYDYGAWAYMVLNHTYSIHLNASGPFAVSGPSVGVVFHGADGTNTSVPVTLSPTFTPSSGFKFTIDTGTAPFSQPGFVIFEAGNSTDANLGFAYDWISWPAPVGGTLNVSVVAPGSSQILSGYPQFNPWPFNYFAPVIVDPNCCTTPNTFTVHVTLNGVGVYNALVQAQVPTTSVLAWQGSRIQAATQSYGNPHEQGPTTLSWTYTNQTGYAVVYTWNLIQPTPYFVNASFGAAKGGTVYQLSPGPNIKTTDVANGKYSQVDTVAFVLTNLRQPVNPTTENLWAPNSVNQSGYYNMFYGWQGEILPVSTNDYQGHSMPGTSVWLGSMDFGGENKFYSYQPTFGVVGVTNTSGTANITDPTGNATIFIPDNMTDNNYFVYGNGQTAGFAYVAASMAGQYNRTFSYTEPCPPTLPNPAALITCQFNDTYQRNYSAVPIVILQDPVNVTTQTTSGVARDFFGSGANISWHVNVQLPSNDPFISGYGFNWLPGTEHVTSVKAYVDNQFAGDLTPSAYSQWQNYTANGNLSGDYSAGTHNLRVVATDSVGHTFTRDHTFVVGSINITNLGIQNTYTVLPYTLDWHYVIPAGEMNNHTFSQSLEIRYVASGCGGTVKCPQVVNYTMKIHDGVIDYNQSLNTTLLNLNHFYGGATSLPPGQYQIIVWLNANHSGSIANQVNTQLVFDPVQGQINGPTTGTIVPLGNVTISYAYSGQYIQNATLAVFPVGSTAPVFSAFAYVPGLAGLRGGAAQWTAVTPGAYQIVLELGTPYGHDNITSNITVAETASQVYLNQSHGTGAIMGANPATLGAILAIVAAIVGLLIGLFVAPSLRGGGGAKGPIRPAATAAGAAAPWSEDTKGSGSTKLRCSVCQEEFETDFALHQHLKISHGIEE